MARCVSWNRWFGRGAVIVVLALLCTGVVGAANSSNPSTIYACVNNTNGDNANGDRNDHGDEQSGKRGDIRIIAASACGESGIIQTPRMLIPSL